MGHQRQAEGSLGTDPACSLDRAQEDRVAGGPQERHACRNVEKTGLAVLHAIGVEPQPAAIRPFERWAAVREHAEEPGEGGAA